MVIFAAGHLYFVQGQMILAYSESPYPPRGQEVFSQRVNETYLRFSPIDMKNLVKRCGLQKS